MGYVAQSLGANERILWQGREHWTKAFAVPLWATVFGVLLAVPTAGISLILVVAAPLGALLAWIQWQSVELAVTDQRVIAKTGLLSRRVEEVRLRQVESTNVDQGVIGRLMGYGTVVVAGTGGTRVALTGVGNPMGLRATIQQQAAGARAG